MSYNEQFVTTTATASSAMEKHVKFWDRKNKGYITPVDAIFGFINLGYGLVISVTLGTFLGVLCSYSTQESWMPDVLCRTRTEKLQQCVKGEPYNSIGELDLELFEDLFSKHAKSDISGKTITIKELLEWNEATYKAPVTWSVTALEWMAIYLLVGSKGVVKKEDIQAAYDGTLFYQVRDRNKHHRTMIIQGASAADTNNNLLNVSGVKVSKSYIRQLESQVNHAVHHVLPRDTVSLLETRLRHWLSFVQQQQQPELIQGRSILKGVPTPMPTRRPLFVGDNGDGDKDDNESDSTYRSSPLFDGGLTGVMGINLLEQAVPLTGVQTNEEHSADGVGLYGLKDDSITENDIKDNSDDGIHDLAFSMAGVRSEKEDDGYLGNSHIDWLHTGQLTGVSPSTSATTHRVMSQKQETMDDLQKEDDDFDKRPGTTALDTPSASTPPLTETSSVTSDLDGSDDTSTKDHEEELNSKTNMNVTNSSSKKKNKKNKKKKNKQQALTPPAKEDGDLQDMQKSPTIVSPTSPLTGSLSSLEYNDDSDLPASPSDITGQQIKHSTFGNAMKTTSHHHSSWSSVTDGVSSND